jgi:hypothetical protein
MTKELYRLFCREVIGWTDGWAAIRGSTIKEAGNEDYGIQHWE